ncbi:MAG: crossover junction endodeoxyribonuclease RuvC [Pelagerythrobacter marensis]|nr:MAG: crossover junction endodeoxyribonuclease RuvC [Pelagerythrobacter marensis]
MTLILGLDPSLSCTGWGVIRAEGSRLAHIAHGEVPSAPAMPMPLRLAGLYATIQAVIADYRPERAAVEEVFVNQNAQSTLKLAQARGAVLAACGVAGLPVGGADKRQVQAMLRVLLPGITVTGADAADALAVAIADAHLSPRTMAP